MERDTLNPCQFGLRIAKQMIGSAKILILTLCIGFQVGIVVASKLVQLISIIITLPLFSWFYYCKRMNEDSVSESSASTNKGSSNPENTSLELNLYILYCPKLIWICVTNQITWFRWEKVQKNQIELYEKLTASRGLQIWTIPTRFRIARLCLW